MKNMKKAKSCFGLAKKKIKLIETFIEIYPIYQKIKPLEKLKKLAS